MIVVRRLLIVAHDRTTNISEVAAAVMTAMSLVRSCESTRENAHGNENPIVGWSPNHPVGDIIVDTPRIWTVMARGTTPVRSIPMSGRVMAAENEDRPMLTRGRMVMLEEERKERMGINVYKRGELMISGQLCQL
jgi:hypothetical protein